MRVANVQGHDLAYEVTGQGSSSIILETGLGAESSDWDQVAQLVAGAATTIRYDRLGRGESALPEGPRDALAMVADLRALLADATVPPPYIFVGHSFGGLIGQVFAQRYPSEIAGLVLVESVHPAQFDLIGGAFPALSDDESPSLAAMREFWTDGWRNIDATKEKIDFASSFRQAPRAGELNGTPLRVLTTGSFLKIPFLPPAAGPALQSRWLNLQAQLLQLSSDSFQSLWPSSSHFLQRENPAAIAATIVDLIQMP